MRKELIRKTDLNHCNIKSLRELQLLETSVNNRFFMRNKTETKTQIVISYQCVQMR